MSDYPPADSADSARGGIRHAFSMEERDLAFEVWAFRAGRNAAETARILATDYDLHVTDRGIRHWIKSDDWGARADRELAELAPNIYAGIVTDIIYGAQAGASYLRRVNEGDPSTRVDNGRVDIGRVTAANSALAKAGFADRVNRDASGIIDPPQTNVQQINVSTMTPEQLSAYQRQQVIEAQSATHPEKQEQE